MREIILGTAGHVDHGKTSLIRALTGIETDRLREEKERGITIELGFAWLDLPCGHRLGIVDVPGHEKFVRNMVAGAAGMDLVAFVIAADEGIMPQTMEHFAICRLLGVRDGIIVLSKKDTVEADWLEMVREEVREFFQASFLEKAPIVAVDSISGDGLPELVRLLDAKVKAMDFQEDFGPFRMAVDRVFSMKGFGTVITGTSLSGRIAVGEELALYPGGLSARIRGIQVHGQEVELAEAGHRTAINLQGVDREQIHRGDMAATPGTMKSVTLLEAEFQLLPTMDKPLHNRSLVRVHLGSREIIGRLLLLTKDVLLPGEMDVVQIRLQEEVAVWPGDRYVVRSYSPITTIGGGWIIKLASKKRKRSLERDKEANSAFFSVFTGADQSKQLSLLIYEQGVQGITSADLAAQSGIFGKKLKKLLQYPVSSGALLVVDAENQRLLSAGIAEELEQKIVGLLDEFHEKYPMKSGLAKEELRSRLRPAVDQKVLQQILARLGKKGLVEQEGAEIRRAGYRVSLQVDEQRLEERIVTLYAEAGLQPPSLGQLAEYCAGVPDQRIRQVLDLLLQKGQIARISETLWFHADALRALREKLLAFLQEKGEIDAQGFKELTGLTRKFSIPLLEYFDKIKLTVRIGDRRVLRKVDPTHSASQ